MNIGLVVFLILLTQTIISTAIAGYYEFNITLDDEKNMGLIQNMTSILG